MFYFLDFLFLASDCFDEVAAMASDFRLDAAGVTISLLVLAAAAGVDLLDDLAALESGVALRSQLARADLVLRLPLLADCR